MTQQIPCVGAIVFDEGGRLLLVRRANPPAQGLWSIPGGRVEPDETAEEAVVRELVEETGFAGTLVREVGTITRDAPDGGTYVIRDFLMQVTSDAPPVAGDDASEAAWFTLDEVRAAATSPGLVGTLASWGLI